MQGTVRAGTKLHPCQFKANDLNWQTGGEGSVQDHTAAPRPREGLDPGQWTHWTTAFLLMKLLQWCHALFLSFSLLFCPLNLLFCWGVSVLS